MIISTTTDWTLRSLSENRGYHKTVGGDIYLQLLGLLQRGTVYGITDNTSYFTHHNGTKQS